MKRIAALLASCMFAAVCAANGESAAPERSHSFRRPARMEMLRPGEVKPRGWLRDWCAAARDGYISRMDEVDKAFPRAWSGDFHPRGKYLDWSDPEKGAWCTEGGAYWFEGLVRLAWELDDAELKEYAKKRLGPILERMNPNAIGFVYWMDRNDPAQMDEIERANHGFIVGSSGRTTRALLAYWEATGDERAIRALTWCLDDPRFYFFGNPITLPAAACDTWRYSGDAKLASALDNFYATEPYPDRWPSMRYDTPLRTDDLNLTPRQHTKEWDWRRQHGVLFYESVLSLMKGTCWTGDARHFANATAWMDWVDLHCRQPHGVAVADESYGHPGPGRGTETCVVAGDILAYATRAAITGEGRFADHVERSFFNAGPACVSRDFMHHVYFQTPNRTDSDGAFDVGPGRTSGVYKTKHWPLCCTAALARILPGYVQWMWMKPASGGLAATLYAPNTLETKLGGTSVRIETKTDYPFGETLEMSVSPEKPMSFPLRLRVPEWCVTAAFAVNGAPVTPAVGADGFAVIEREWRTGDRVTLRLPMSPKTETMRDFNDGGKAYCSISYGPLLFAYALPEKDENTPASGARTDWRLVPSRVLDGAKVVRSPMPAKWDWPRSSPLTLKVKAADGSPLDLVPYGCAKLRISMFPVADASPQKSALLGKTDKTPTSYRPGETMTFTLSAKGGGSTIRWSRTGDDGRTEGGEAEASGPVVVKTSLDRPGFVRLVAELLDANGKALARFDGGAGADVEMVRQDKPEPADFDDFWARRKAALKEVPMDGATCREVASGRDDVRLYEVSIPCKGPRPATGFLSVPSKAGRYPALMHFHGYNASWGSEARTTPKPETLRADMMVFDLSAHGYEFNRDESYYTALRKSCGSNGYDYAFDPEQNSDPEKAYFSGMTYRIMRALEYLKKRVEWDGKRLVVEGGSQGGLQSVWAAALDHDVTECRPYIPWCCNIAGPKSGRAHGDWHVEWVPALGYYDAANMARRIPATCRTTVTWAGLGDYICPPSGVMSFYNNLRCPKSITFIQGATHFMRPPKPWQTAAYESPGVN
ncbi:MAG: glycoside hydrolase family 127 protein [Kiritimatiellae bacterium]|nr:glycoside hydrolase family 127 protein [Kiritimatiellia bacterium]